MQPLPEGGAERVGNPGCLCGRVPGWGCFRGVCQLRRGVSRSPRGSAAAAEDPEVLFPALTLRLAPLTSSDMVAEREAALAALGEHLAISKLT